jgi:hypothetical protein
MRSLLRKIVFSLGEDHWEQRGGRNARKVYKPQQEKTLTAISDQGF